MHTTWIALSIKNEVPYIGAIALSRDTLISQIEKNGVLPYFIIHHPVDGFANAKAWLIEHGITSTDIIYVMEKVLNE